MEKFVSYSLEGMIAQHGRQVWVTLGVYRSLAELLAGQLVAISSRGDIARTRVTTNYRVEGGQNPTPALGRALPAEKRPAPASDNVTVA